MCVRLPSALLGALSYHSSLCEIFQAAGMTDVQHSPEADNQSHGKEPQCNHLTDTKEGNRAIAIDRMF